MKDHEKHIRDNSAANKGLAWCGATVTNMDWAFQDIDHAAINARSGGRITTCPACVAAISQAFKDT